MSSAELTSDRSSGALRQMAQAWGQFWFRPADPLILGFMRLCLGSVILFVHLAYTYDLDEFFGAHAWLDKQLLNEFRHEAPIVSPTDGWEESAPAAPVSDEDVAYMQRWGINPHQAVSQGHRVWSIWFHVTDPVWMRVVHFGVLTCIALFTAGLFTRVTGILTWVGVMSYFQRAPTTVFGMDAMVSLLLLYLVIGPSGDALSLDRLFGWSRGAHSVGANVALRLIQVNFCIIYLVAGISKLQGAAWWNGTAVWGTLANPEFCPMTNPIYMQFLRYISARRWLWEAVTTTGTLATLIFEISFPFLIWQRWSRWLLIIGAVMLHFSIAIAMGLVAFSMVMLSGVASFIPAPALRAVFTRRTLA
jgi:hypothetical protein